MALGIFLTLIFISGIVYGAKKKNTKLIIFSAVAQTVLTAVWIYFCTHPY